MRVPEVLLSGDHQKIREWRKAEALKRTARRRPDLLKRRRPVTASWPAPWLKSSSRCIHHPVVDRNGRIVTSAITWLDLHDIARSSRTYGVRALYVVHPVPEQREFARSVIDHWHIGYGRSFDSRRVEALDLIEVVTDLDAAVAAAERAAGRRPELVHTSRARSAGDELRRDARADGGRGRGADFDYARHRFRAGAGGARARRPRTGGDSRRGRLQSSVGARGREHHSRPPARPLSESQEVGFKR